MEKWSEMGWKQQRTGPGRAQIQSNFGKGLEAVSKACPMLHRASKANCRGSDILREEILKLLMDWKWRKLQEARARNRRNNCNKKNTVKTVTLRSPYTVPHSRLPHFPNSSQFSLKIDSIYMFDVLQYGLDDLV